MAPVILLNILHSSMPREVASFSGRRHVCVPGSAVAISSMDGSLREGGIIPICWYDGVCGFSVTFNDGLAIGKTSFYFLLKSSL